MNETGFRIGVRKYQLLIMKRKRIYYLSNPENKESAIVTKAISAGGYYILVFLIFSSQLYMSQ